MNWRAFCWLCCAILLLYLNPANLSFKRQQQKCWINVPNAKAYLEHCPTSMMELFFEKFTAEIRSVFSHKACIIEDSKSASKMCLKLAGKAPELHHSCVVFYLRQINTFNSSIYWFFFVEFVNAPTAFSCLKSTVKFVQS